jgi:hypothetical protein
MDAGIKVTINELSNLLPKECENFKPHFAG